jgi:LysR family glycine cleavage system transcriptional activator
MDWRSVKFDWNRARAFLVTAEEGSLSAAARALGMAQPTLGRQVGALEEELGVVLFERVGRGVELSDDGREFFAGIRDGFEQLRRTTERMARRGRGRRTEVVRVQTPPSFAGRWLLPRLPALLAANPGLDIRVNAERDRHPGDAGFDLTIVYGDARSWARSAQPLLEELLQPLCAPALATGIRTPAELLERPLIGTRGNGLSWAEWFRRHGVEALRPGPAMELDPSDVAIDAAVKGLGIVLESDVLTEEERADGRLVAPLPHYADSTAAYWLLPSGDAGDRAAVGLVRDWLLAEAGR